MRSSATMSPRGEKELLERRHRVFGGRIIEVAGDLDLIDGQGLRGLLRKPGFRRAAQGFR